ncbi:glutathione S-transferase family protein [Pedomonas mirosovicensis]|uniref:glutathione S-transferase family protein n=1 Tax=Pedomonas mirosovicensis TaxID=2908641 RepID=UPI002169AA4F|nr:glutathione S-transferase family protein [Pedomonas mirosovicensis]MCH8683850.1 glutathione S-transferase family protein [Pedomonas mirosovicensis]
MELFWAPQTRSITALWMLEEAGLPYSRTLIDIRSGPERPADFLKVNPMGKVPALRDGEAMMGETTAICAYVADKARSAELAPTLDDPARGRYLHWLYFRAGCMEAAFGEKLQGWTTDSTAAGWGSFDKTMDVVESAVTPGPWLLGDRFSAADVAMGSSLWYGLYLLKVIEGRPGIEAYVARCTERPAFQRAMAINAAGA